MAEENILLIQLTQLGDILLTTPCMRAIRESRPNARITFLSHPMGRLIVDDSPYVDEHFQLSANKDIWKDIKLAHTLRSRKFDLVIDFMNNPRSAFFSFVSGANEKVAFRSSRKFAYNHIVEPHNMRGYIVDEKFALLRSLGMDPKNRRLVLPWHETHTHPLLRLLGENPALKDAPLRVVLSPTHRRAHRQWPLEYFAELADRLVKKWQASVLWIWGPGEEDVIDTVMGLCAESTIKAPPTTFREAAALMANMDLFVGNSNGPSHVAVAVDVCSFQLHGHTDVVSWCPMTEYHRGIQASDFRKVKLPEMSGITVDAVWEGLANFKPTIESRRIERGAGLQLKWRR